MDTKKLIVGPITKWVPPLLIIYIFFPNFIVSLSLQMEEMERVLDGEDPNSGSLTNLQITLNLTFPNSQ
jgi:hypothetical protein